MTIPMQQDAVIWTSLGKRGGYKNGYGPNYSKPWIVLLYGLCKA